MLKKIMGLAGVFILLLLMSCGPATPVQEAVSAKPAEEEAMSLPKELAGAELAVSDWEIINNFPRGMYVVVELEHKFPIDFDASTFKAKVGEGSVNIAPQNDWDSQDPDKVIFEVGNSNHFYTWTEIDSGIVRIKDKEGNEESFETGPFVYNDSRFRWDEEESENVKVLFYRARAFVRPNMVLVEAEKLLGRFSFIPERKIRIVVYESRDDINTAIPFRSKATEEQLVTMGMAFDSIDAVFVLREGEFLNTTRHELMHLVFNYLTEKRFDVLPTWLNEGLAMYAGDENLSGWHEGVLTKALENKGLLSLREMSSFSGEPKITDLSYAEAHSFIKFLVEEYGQGAMLRFLATLNDNFSIEVEEAIEGAYGKSLDVLEKEWKDALVSEFG